MSLFRVACAQMRSGRDPAANLAAVEALVREAAGEGASYVQTPEMTNILVRSRGELLEKISTEAEDALLARMRAVAAELGIFVHLGSLAIIVGPERVANRAFVIAPDGSIAARYDKIHMFDVDLENGESWRESATYQPGEAAVTVDLGPITAGLAICYDVRFPHLFRSYAKAGCGLLTAPAAFTRQTGAAHWHILQRARAIENGAFVVTAAQGGKHEDGRETYGHSLVIDPWGRILAEADHDEPGIIVADIDPADVAVIRGRVPSLANERAFAPARVEADRIRTSGAA
ncbi:(R)-stereoselective amidase [Hartmannibacter diazotrophicus]|uniref:(R)-stereoselective amidase n=1 Tax=Hartmannibacter diazotrophicus TaxID=1482074 RepID=A0A2C9DAM8_9HYPH|nr:carbon-nitrogen hydrolase family protein [Hartmannibacter diazotrophicus]SON57347.1 (R)-stereoselective amidase [Hartmannibacter diazotrophicus]